MNKRNTAITMAMHNFVTEHDHKDMIEVYEVLDNIVSAGIDEDCLKATFCETYEMTAHKDLLKLIEDNADMNYMYLRKHEEQIVEHINAMAPDLSYSRYVSYISELPKLNKKEKMALEKAVEDVFGTKYHTGKAIQFYYDLYIEVNLEPTFEALVPRTKPSLAAAESEEKLIAIENRAEFFMKIIDDTLLAAQILLVDAAVEDRLPQDFNELNLSEFIERGAK